MQCEAAVYLMHVSYCLLVIEYQSVRLREMADARTVMRNNCHKTRGYCPAIAVLQRLRSGFVPILPHVFLAPTGTTLSLPGSGVWASLLVSGEITDRADSSVKKVTFCGQPL